MSRNLFTTVCFFLVAATKSYSCDFNIIPVTVTVNTTITVHPGQALDNIIANVKNGTAIEILSGDYKVGMMKLKGKEHIKITGKGRVNIIQDQPSLEGILVVTNCRNIEIENLTFNYTGAKIGSKKNCGRGIMVSNSNMVSIHNNKVNNTYEHGIAIYGSENYVTDNIMVYDNVISNPGNKDNQRGWGIWFYKNVQKGSITRNTITGFYGGGIFVDDEHNAVVKVPTPCKNIVVEKNIVKNDLVLNYTLTGIGVEGSDCIRVSNNRISIKSFRGEGIKVSKGQAKIGYSDVSVTDNVIDTKVKTYNMKDTSLYKIHLKGNQISKSNR